MIIDQLSLLCAALLLVAFLYSSVGHAGASGYIAIMSLAALTPAVIKPTALVLNILVASIASWQFWRAGHFSWRLFWPFAVLSAPLAFAGGYLNLPSHVFKLSVGIVLLASALYLPFQQLPDGATKTPARGTAITIGGSIGLMAGLTGTGGGIFLTPLLLFMRWAPMKTASAVSAVFILINSIAGLLGNFGSSRHLPTQVLPFVFSVLVGGGLGSYFGSRYLSPTWIKRALAVVLLIAGLKLILTA